MYAVHTPLFQPPQRSFICTKAQTKRKNVFRGLHETARHKNTFLRNFILIFYEQEKQKKKNTGERVNKKRDRRRVFVVKI